MDNTLIKLRSDARKAGVPNYGSMSRAELQDALKGSKPNKRKSAANVTGTKPKRKSATAVVADKPKRKPKRKAAVASSDMSEQQAKRIVRKYAGKRGRRPAEFYEAQAVLGNEAQVTHSQACTEAQERVGQSDDKPHRHAFEAEGIEQRQRRAQSDRPIGNRLEGRLDWRADWQPWQDHEGATEVQGRLRKGACRAQAGRDKDVPEVEQDRREVHKGGSACDAQVAHRSHRVRFCHWHASA